MGVRRVVAIPALTMARHAVREVTVPSRQCLDRLWKDADDAWMRGHYRRCKRILEILLDHDVDRWEHARDRLDVRELRPGGPNPQMIRMSHAELDRLMVDPDDGDPWTWIGENEPDEEETISDDDLLLYSLDIREGEDAADQLEESLAQHGRGKDRWKPRRRR